MSATTEAAPQPKSRKRKLLIALAAGTVLALGGGLFYVAGGGRVQAAPSAPKAVKPIFITLDPLTVNLHSESRGGRFLHVGVSLRMPDEKSQARVNEALPELRSRLLLLLSDRDPTLLATPADKIRLAEQIRDELNRPIVPGLPPHGITAVSFNAFVVQ